jgi:small subunit ribosomal protein S21
MAFIQVHENESLERAIKRFKKRVDSEGILKEFRERQYYKKPSRKRYEKKKSIQRKNKLQAIKDKAKRERL